MKQVFFDLDGTLLDAKERLFRLFKHLMPESQLSFDEYWSLKKTGMSHAIILKERYSYGPDKIEKFTNDWMRLIENKEWLKYDVPVEGATELLESLNEKKVQLYIVTNRQKKDLAYSQIKQLKWDSFFQEILVTEQKITKSAMMAPYIVNRNDCYLVADTGADIKEGKLLKIRTVAITTGFLGAEKLQEYDPDLMINDITEFKVL